MAQSQTKIAQALTPEELTAFLECLLKVPHEQMAAQIQELAKEHGISIGKTAAYEFRNKELMPWLKRLESRQQKARLLEEMGGEETGRTLADAAAAELGQISFDMVSELDGKIDINSEEGREIFNVLTTGVKRLRDSDRAMLKQLQAQVSDTKSDLTNPQLTEQQRAERMRARFGV